MQKKLVQSSLALTAAAALGLGGAFMAGPAAAAAPSAEPTTSASAPAPAKALTEQKAIQEAKSIDDVKVNAFGFDEKSKTLHLGVETKADAKSDAIEDLKAKYGADSVEVQAGVGELKPRAANDLVGGAGYVMSVEGGTSACSAGFSGWNGAGEPVVLTAGHCAEGTVPTDMEKPSTSKAHDGGDDQVEGFTPAGTGVPGEWGYAKFGTPAKPGEDTGNEGDIDFAVLNVDASKYNVKPEITDWSTAGDDDLSKSTNKITSWGAHTNSGTVNKSGRTTGHTEGDVFTAYNEAFEFSKVGGHWVHGFGVLSPLGDPFSAPGDSGGGVYQGSKAVGVISGGNPYEWQGETYDFSWVADLDYSLEHSNNEDFTFEDPNAEPEAPAAPVVKDQTIKPNGAVTGKAEGATKVTLNWSAASGPQAGPEGPVTVDVDANGNFTAEGPEAPGTYNYTAVASNEGGDSPAAEFVVTVEEEAAADDTAQADANAEGANTDANAEGAEADANAEGAEADANAKGAEADASADGAEADANTKGAEADASAGSDDGKDGEEPAERTIEIQPKEIVDTDFVNQDKGVTITVGGFDEGENVTLEVVAGPNNVQGIELHETANKDGVAAFSVYGVNDSDPSVYRGTYDVKVTGDNDTADEKALTGSFEVVAAEDGNGGGGGGSDLPRTGAELTGLAAGAGLLVVGGAAVVLTMRRNSKKN